MRSEEKTNSGGRSTMLTLNFDFNLAMRSKHISIQFICTTTTATTIIRTKLQPKVKNRPCTHETDRHKSGHRAAATLSSMLNESIDWICSTNLYTHTFSSSSFQTSRSGQMEWRTNDYERGNPIRRPPHAIFYLRFLFRLRVSFIFHLNKLPITRFSSFSLHYYCYYIAMLLLLQMQLLLLLLVSFLSI